MSVTNKDSMVNKPTMKDIRSFFSFSNPKAKFRHLWIFSFGLLNITSIVVYFMEVEATNAAYIFISITAVLALMSVVQYIRRKANFRFEIYIICAMGIFNGILGSAISSSWFYRIQVFITVVFLIYFISIEFTSQPTSNPFVRDRKVSRPHRYGYDYI